MAPPNAALVVVAAGTGSRLGAREHKALVDLGDEPLALFTLRRLLRCGWLEPVVLVGHADDRDALAARLAGLPRRVTLVDGGARRQDSVAAGLAALPERVEVVLVHDAARPFPPLERLPQLADAARRHGAALLAVPVADTLKRGADGRVVETVDRAGLWAAQTPQAFRRAALAEHLDRAGRAGRTVTDETALFEEAPGLDVAFVEGSRGNFKVTTPEDLALARRLAARTEGA